MFRRFPHSDVWRLVLAWLVWLAAVGLCIGPSVVQGLARCRGLC